MYNDTPKTKYVMYSKSGDEIMESNSFLGMIGQTALACILGPAIFARDARGVPPVALKWAPPVAGK